MADSHLPLILQWPIYTQPTKEIVAFVLKSTLKYELDSHHAVFLCPHTLSLNYIYVSISTFQLKQLYTNDYKCNLQNVSGVNDRDNAPISLPLPAESTFLRSFLLSLILPHNTPAVAFNVRLENMKNKMSALHLIINHIIFK